MKWKFIILNIIIVFIPFMLSGCWDRIEVRDLLVITGIAVDKIPGEDPILLTIQTLNPQREKKVSGGGGQQQEPYFIMESHGKTFFDAIHKLHTQIPKEIFFSQNKIVIIGKTLAESGVSDIMDFMERDYRFRRNGWILVAQNDAKDILEGETLPEKVPSQGIEQVLNKYNKETVIFPITRNEFSLKLRSDAKASFTPLIQLEEQENLSDQTAKGQPGQVSSKTKKIVLNKTAVFKNNKFTGTLSEYQSSGLLWLINKVRGYPVVIPYMVNGKTEYIVIDILKGNAKVTPDITNNEITFEIACEANAILRETEINDIEINNPEVIKEIDTKAEKLLKEQVAQTIYIAQHDFKADFIGFASSIHNNHPAKWKEIENQWNEYFPEVKYTISFKVNISRFGMVNNPMEKGKE